MANKFEAKESYTHKFAKELLWSWLTDGWEDNDNWFNPGITIQDNDDPAFQHPISYRSDFIHMEYPITNCFPYLIDEMTCSCDYTYRTPAQYSPCIKCKEFMKKEKLLAVADIAIEHKGNIAYIFEVVHKNDLSPEKEAIYHTLMKKNGYEPRIFTIEAQHILGQIKKPRILHAKQIIDSRIYL